MLNFEVYKLVASINAMVFGSNKFRIRRSQSKASYLAYKRERGAPDSEGSYKRTMSPTARLEDWPPPRERDDPVLLRVTPHHQTPHELSKSHSVDALHHRMEERTNAHHSVEVIGKLSHELNKKLQATDTRVRSESNNNSNIIINNNDCYEDRLRSAMIQRPLEKRHDQERLSPQSIEVLNDRNRQLERERRKIAANCESGPDNKLDMDDFYRERSATIEMTSRNVELLNRRNALPEKCQSSGSSMSEIPSIENLNHSGTEKFLHNSPSRFSKSENEDSLGRSQGAVSRRSGSCSSSSSSSTRSSLEHSRSSPSKIYSTSETNDVRKSLSELENSKATYNSTPRSKVSSPSQTENSWTKFGSSQTESLFTNRLRRTSSSGSRSSSLSSTSKMSSSSSLSLSPRYSPVEAKDSPCVSPQPGIESLTLMQRTEVVLRVNATTMDVASQTETIEDDAKNSEKMLPELRKKLPEEIECEQLSRDLVNVLAPNDKLVPILVPAPEHKKPTDYVSGLFRVETTLQPRSKRPVSFGDTSSLSTSMESGIDGDRKSEMPSTPTSPLSPTSAYFTTSEGKARFLTRYSRDMTEADVPASGTSDRQDDSIDLKQKKEELVLRLDRKVVVLRAEQEAVREDGEINDALGAKVSSRISAVARPAEASKYRLHVEEVGKITSLLLGLSGRLARAENALHGMPPDHDERKTLEGKRDKLLEQLEEAKILKNNIDKRSINVAAILSKYLTHEEFADYQHFITMKTKLIMDGREIQDKVKLGEEQLAALKETMG